MDILPEVDLSERASLPRRHPWESVRWSFFSRVLDEHAVLDAPSVLDVGAGDSWLGAQLAAVPTTNARTIVCWDIAYTDDDLAEAPRGTVRTRAAPDRLFDLILLLDVLEHLDNPATFLSESVRPCLGPGAILLASVPAHPRLYGQHDLALGHRRRYRRSEFIEQIGAVGTILAEGPLFLSLTIPRAAQNAADRMRTPTASTRTNGWHHGRAVTAAITTALRVDASACRALSRGSIPVSGLSHWAIARSDTRRAEGA